MNWYRAGFLCAALGVFTLSAAEIALEAEQISDRGAWKVQNGDTFGGAFLIRIDPAGFQRGIIDEGSFIQRLSRFHVFECGGQGADDICLFREFKDDRHGFSGRNGQRGIQ